MWSGFQHGLGLLEARCIHTEIHHRGHLGKHRHDRIDELGARRGLDFLLGHRPKQLETAPRLGRQPVRLASTGVEVPGGVIIFRARRERAHANAKPLAEEPTEVARQRLFTQRL